ncbi:NAD(P)-dependent alcohol dehydrogenase [Povalibacter sp.]|uniref:NAD(P)-dependent alcohol dehydrogenase n=1 Tax=Povalibacter sp. TaxID=1962978 RepID=UPI0032C223FE
MRAVSARCYGSPEVLRLEAVARPQPADDQILIRVHAASLNPYDWHLMRGSPYVMRLGGGIGQPKDPWIGADFAGTVEAVGAKVTRYKAGDAVFGSGGGTLADYVLKRETESLAIKPATVTFEQAAGVNVAGITALQALRDHGGLQPGQRVLINGASGGVGTFAVQIAKALGAHVTGVCSTKNVELVRSLGADEVIDYTQTDFATGERRYDLIVDNVANRSISDLRRVLQPQGRLVIVGGAPGHWIGPLALPIKAVLFSPFVDQPMGMMMAKPNHQDMQTLADLMASGKLIPVIDRTYPLNEVAEAMRYLETGRARGKVVVTVGPTGG